MKMLTAVRSGQLPGTGTGHVSYSDVLRAAHLDLETARNVFARLAKQQLEQAAGNIRHLVVATEVEVWEVEARASFRVFEPGRGHLLEKLVGGLVSQVVGCAGARLGALETEITPESDGSFTFFIKQRFVP